MELSRNDKYIVKEMKLMEECRHLIMISILYVAITTQYAYIVMECFDGWTLRHALFSNDNSRETKWMRRKRITSAYKYAKY